MTDNLEISKDWTFRSIQKKQLQLQGQLQLVCSVQTQCCVPFRIEFRMNLNLI